MPRISVAEKPPFSANPFGTIWMAKHDRFTAIQNFHKRSERRIAEILALIAREDSDAVGLQRIQSVFDFAYGAIDIRQRQYRKQTKPARMILHNLCAVLVA